MTLPEYRNIPTHACGAGVYVCRSTNGRVEWLVLRRSAHEMYPGLWQQVAGGIEKGETAWQGALRELKEETGLIPERLYAADMVETYYEWCHDSVITCIAFVAFVDAAAEVTLSSEHDRFEWISPDKSEDYFELARHVDGLRAVDRAFVQQPPSEHLRIPLTA